MSSQVYTILLPRQKVAEFEDQVPVVYPKNLTRNKIRLLSNQLTFFHFHFTRFYL